jgi:hypothetical protein
MSEALAGASPTHVPGAYACPGGPRVCGLDAHMLDAHLREAPAAPRVRARRVRRCSAAVLPCGPAALRPCSPAAVCTTPPVRVWGTDVLLMEHAPHTAGEAHARRGLPVRGGARVGRDARSDGAQLPHVALTCRLRPRGGLAWVVIAVLAATLATRCSRCRCLQCVQHGRYATWTLCNKDAVQHGRCAA